MERLSPGRRTTAMKKILVAVKRVIDYNARIRVKPDKVHDEAPTTSFCHIANSWLMG